MLVMFKQKHAKLRGMISGFVLMCVVVVVFYSSHSPEI